MTGGPTPDRASYVRKLYHDASQAVAERTQGLATHGERATAAGDVVGGLVKELSDVGETVHLLHVQNFISGVHGEYGEDLGYFVTALLDRVQPKRRVLKVSFWGDIPTTLGYGLEEGRKVIALRAHPEPEQVEIVGGPQGEPRVVRASFNSLSLSDLVRGPRPDPGRA